jgi:hypothetical protein
MCKIYEYVYIYIDIFVCIFMYIGGQHQQNYGQQQQQGYQPNMAFTSLGFNQYSEPQPSSFSMNSQAAGDISYEDDYENELPLLEELGIRFDHIWSKTQAVINPIKKLQGDILDDADLAGPLFFCLLLGSFLLLAGKVHFGYIYGFSVFGCLGMYCILNLLHPTGLDFVKTCSVLGYCLLPVIGLAGFSVLINLKGVLGMIFATLAIIWSTSAAVRLFDSKLSLTEQYWLVVYPVVLLYSCFVLITVF